MHCSTLWMQSNTCHNPVHGNTLWLQQRVHTSAQLQQPTFIQAPAQPMLPAPSYIIGACPTHRACPNPWCLPHTRCLPQPMVHAPPSKQIDTWPTTNCTHGHPQNKLTHGHPQNKLTHGHPQNKLQQLDAQTHLRHLAHDPHSNTVWGKGLAHSGLALAVTRSSGLQPHI